ncbi:DUF2092 domain-containing protein [Streptomyces sp. ITFR-21]|nr:DUF2092 domain-containing protein [Streptomyces sp. ITFR-21]WNI17191.1 DUF2092 domain-containing protein [Streptomyces sp. ITFR-21]
MRYAVPVAVAGVAAATISLVPALADAGAPSLPPVTAEQLLAKIAASDTRALDGSVRITTDLGLPSVLSGGASGLLGGAAATGSGKDAGSPAAPQTRLPGLLVGSHRLHVAVDGPDRQKLSVIESAAEYSVVHNGTQLWAYDSASNQAYHRTLPRPAAGDRPEGQLPEDFPATPQAAARQILKAADGTAAITVDGTASVAGHSAYQLLVTPRRADATTVGSVRIAVDSTTGVPLKFTLAPKGGGKAVVDIAFTKVSFTAPAASTFTYKPAKGVKVTGGAAAPDPTRKKRPGSSAEPTVVGSGWDAVAVVRTGAGLPAGGKADGKDARSLLDGFGRRVSGSYGSGTLFHTRLVNALLTDDGTLYVGAVTPSALTRAAGAAG